MRSSQLHATKNALFSSGLEQGSEEIGMKIHVKGLVQGVGFRPTVWNLAKQYHLRGQVLNTGQGVQIKAAGGKANLKNFLQSLKDHPPPLANIYSIEWESLSPKNIPESQFMIAETTHDGIRTGILPDAATCQHCVAEIVDPSSRRWHYPFTNCTHCGPRLTIQERIPYDRAHTTMRSFAMCQDCTREYTDPEDRRFHAEPIACPICGPKAWLERTDGQPLALERVSQKNDLKTTATLLKQGQIVAIKGLGGFQLACDATQEQTVNRLRTLKHREGKPFALMARDLDIIRQYCEVSDVEAALLQNPAAPIVLLPRRDDRNLASGVATGSCTYGFMLPNTPLHHLILQYLDTPIILTSGNRAGEPQWTDNESAKNELGHIATCIVMHNRAITQRVDDSVVKVMRHTPRLLRRSRGYAPSPIRLPTGFEQCPHILAMGGELKNTFCFLKSGEALLSHHIGDLEEALTYQDYQKAMERYQLVFGQEPNTIAIDRHPEYLSSKLGREQAQQHGLPLIEVQHHHAHLAACLADNGVPLNTEPVLGILLDGLGYGADGTFWGGEFLGGDYVGFTRLGTIKPVAMPGGTQAIKEPWRNTYAHLMAEMSWSDFLKTYSDLPLCTFLASKPRAVLDHMIASHLNSPLASSCGRLFDAVAAALGLCQDRVTYEGQAAMELEASVDRTILTDQSTCSEYPFRISRLSTSQLPFLNPWPMWEALLEDLRDNTPVSIMATRFHKGLAKGICSMVHRVNRNEDGSSRYSTVALSGGVFQNQVLFELVHDRLSHEGLTVLSHQHVPMNDGGLALGQAVIAAARSRNP